MKEEWSGYDRLYLAYGIWEPWLALVLWDMRSQLSDSMSGWDLSIYWLHAHTWFFAGTEQEELSSALLCTLSKPSQISVAHQGHLTWRLNRRFPPIAVFPSSKEIKYMNASSLFWKAYKRQISVNWWTGFMYKHPLSLCQLGQCSFPSKGRKILTHTGGRN